MQYMFIFVLYRNYVIYNEKQVRVDNTINKKKKKYIYLLKWRNIVMLDIM